jgi:hypothetical protein
MDEWDDTMTVEGCHWYNIAREVLMPDDMNGQLSTSYREGP